MAYTFIKEYQPHSQRLVVAGAREYYTDVNYLLTLNADFSDFASDVIITLAQSDGEPDQIGRIVIPCIKLGAANVIQFKVPSDNSYILYAACLGNVSYVQLYQWE